MRSDGLPRNEAAVMLISGWDAMVRGEEWAFVEAVGVKGAGSGCCPSARLANSGSRCRRLRHRSRDWGPKASCGATRHNKAAAYHKRRFVVTRDGSKWVNQDSERKRQRAG